MQAVELDKPMPIVRGGFTYDGYGFKVDGHTRQTRLMIERTLAQEKVPDPWVRAQLAHYGLEMHEDKWKFLKLDGRRAARDLLEAAAEQGRVNFESINSCGCFHS